MTAARPRAWETLGLGEGLSGGGGRLQSIPGHGLARQSADATAKQFEKIASELEEYRPWEFLPDPAQPYGSPEAMYLDTLGAARDEVVASLEARTKAAAVKQARSEAKLAEQGRPKKADNYQDISGAGPGTDPAYLTARIERDAPEIFEAMQQGEYKSVRQAAIDAGIIKHRPRLSIPLDDDDAAARLIAHKWGDRLTDLLAALAEYIEVEA